MKKSLKNLVITPHQLLKVFMAMVMLLILVFIGVSIVSVPANNKRAENVAKMLVSTPLPEKTTLEETVSRAGKLVGNGNGTQYFGAMLIKSELSLDELNEYYSDYRQNEWEFIVEIQNQNKVVAIEHGELNFTKVENAGDYYSVASWGIGDGFFEYFDIRGH